MLQLSPKSLFGTLNLGRVNDAGTRDVFLQVSKLLANTSIIIARVVNDIATKAATLASPTFTGTVTLPDGSTFSTLGTLANGAVATTQAAADNSTKIATDAFVQAAIAAYIPLPVSIANGGTGSGTTAGALNNLNAIIDNTGAGADITLAIGQKAIVTFSAATSVALHIATGDNQLYRIIISASGNTGSTGHAFLNPNNTTFTNFFRNDGLVASAGSSSVISIYSNAPFLAYDTDIRGSEALVSTKTTSKWVSFKSYGYTGTALYQSNGSSHWQNAASSEGVGDTTTAWTSLGTLSFPIAATGVAIVERIR